MPSENKMGTMPVGRLLSNMSIPLMVSLLIQSMYNIVDGVFVSRVSENALTATSLAYPIQVLMLTISVGTAIGVNTEMSRLIGEKHFRRVSNAAVTGLLLTFLSSLIFVAAGIFLPHTISSMMSSDAEISELCASYLKICMMFSSGIFFEAMFQRFLQASGRTLLSMVSLMVGIATNTILDPIMIFGYFGCPAMGITGAAIATVIGQWLSALIACLLNTFCNPEVKVRFRHYRPTRRLIGRIYKIGAPTMITNGMPSIMVAIMNAMLMPYSSTAVAFFGIYYKLQNFLLMPINGLGQACLPIISFNRGAGNMDRIRKVFRDSIPTAVIISLIATVLFCAIPGPLLSIFAASSDMLALGIPALRIIAVTFVFASVTIVLGYSVSGLGNSVMMMIATIIRQCVLLIPVAYVLSRIAGISSIWYAFWPAELVAVVFMALVSLKKYRQVKRKLQNQLQN